MHDEKENPPRGGRQSDCARHFTLSPATIPGELKELSQWVCWRLEEREGNPTKVPYNAESGRRARSNDPTTWTTFDAAVDAYLRGGYAGIGFMFWEGDGLTGLDLDHVIDLETGEIDPRALEILEQFKGTYCEISPSGTGFRIFTRGSSGRSGKNEGRGKWLEVYTHPSHRYLTVTGHHWPQSAVEVTAQQDALDWLHEKYFTKPAKPQSATKPATTPNLNIDDSDLLDKARAAANGHQFGQLWNGDTTAHRGDHSSADLALCSLLAFWTAKDAAQMDRLFRQSGLMRPKWDSRRGDTTYGQITIDKAITECHEVYIEAHKGNGGNGHDRAPPADYSAYPESRDYEKDKGASAGPPPPPELPKLPRIVMTVDDLLIEPPAPPFVIEGYMPLDVQALIATGGTGKSTLDILQNIHVILGRPLWGMEIALPAPVVYVTAEDGEDRLKWRLFHIVNQLGLNRSERQQVAEHFHIVNLVGTGRRLVAQDRDGNLVITPLADQIIEEFLPIAPVRVSFDPMVKFGPGERFVNDAEDAVVNAGHRITQNLHCATSFTHHVSKEVARNAIVDHHSGRGGSALGDGVRAAYQLLTITPDIARNYPGAELYQSDITDGRLLAFHITKLTDAKRPLEPMILRRSGWLFEPVEMPGPAEIEAKLKTAAVEFRQAEAKRNLDILVTYLKERSFLKPSRKNLEDTHNEVGLGRNDLRAALAKGLIEGVIVERDLPADEQQGARKTYLAVEGSK